MVRMNSRAYQSTLSSSIFSTRTEFTIGTGGKKGWRRKLRTRLLLQLEAQVEAFTPRMGRITLYTAL